MVSLGDFGSYREVGAVLRLALWKYSTSTATQHLEYQVALYAQLAFGSMYYILLVLLLTEATEDKHDLSSAMCEVKEHAHCHVEANDYFSKLVTKLLDAG